MKEYTQQERIALIEATIKQVKELIEVFNREEGKNEKTPRYKKWLYKN